MLMLSSTVSQVSMFILDNSAALDLRPVSMFSANATSSVFIHREAESKGGGDGVGDGCVACNCI